MITTDAAAGAKTRIRDAAIELMARKGIAGTTTQDIAQHHGIPLIFKASFGKANRSRADAFRGPGLDEGLRILAAVKQDTGLPIVTDIHEPGHAKIAAEVVEAMRAAYGDWWKKTRPLMVNEAAPMSPTRPFHVLYEKQIKAGGIPMWKQPQL